MDDNQLQVILDSMVDAIEEHMMHIGWRAVVLNVGRMVGDQASIQMSVSIVKRDAENDKTD